MSEGAEKLFEYSKVNRFAEGKPAQLPRVYRRIYRDAVFKLGPPEPMAAFIAERYMAKAELEVADSGCELARWLLEHSGLGPDERRYALGQAGGVHRL